MANPKFNKSRTGTWFPIKQFRFDLTDHPTTKDTAKKTVSYKVSFSNNEKQILDGLANTLQTKAGAAIRVALFERKSVGEPRKAHKALQPAKVGKGEGVRTSKLQVRLTASEAASLSELSAKYGFSASELLRYYVVELTAKIRAGKKTSLSGSKILTQVECMKIWDKTNQGREKGSKISALQKASTKAQANHESMTQEEYSYWKEIMDQMRLDGTLQQFMTYQTYQSGTVEGFLDFEALKYWYNAENGGAQDDADYEALFDLDRHKGINAVARQMASWCNEMFRWEDFIEEATAEWESRHYVLSEEEEAELEAMWDTIPLADDRQDLDAPLEHKGYMSKKQMSYDPRQEVADTSSKDILLSTFEYDEDQYADVERPFIEPTEVWPLLD